ncbi:hypothetical protein OG194_18820 [Streptomyces sp. NBC_01288]|uniref:hypothetical protein n=1 Tax=Streptomyces sp. NBC_01288 TaxID=2903814 RepID=UPI002E14D4B0|nr:hypothetical protein OG194_18820 [Streptomyces sp. NBC_01288]
MDAPPVLGLPLDGPAANPNCGVCAALARQRTDARAAGDFSKVSDLNVELRSHQAAVS